MNFQSMLSISWFVRPCVCMSACSLFELPFKPLFAPTSQSRMPKIFIDFKSLGKSNGKKWSQIWILLLIKGVKLMRKKKLVFGQILPYWAGYFWYWCFSLRLTVLKTPLPKVFKLFRFLESWGKSNGKKWSQILKKKLLIKGVKSPRQIFLLSENFALLAVFFW